jgi:hypothetical protein
MQLGNNLIKSRTSMTSEIFFSLILFDNLKFVLENLLDLTTPLISCFYLINKT